MKKQTSRYQDIKLLRCLLFPLKKLQEHRKNVAYQKSGGGQRVKAFYQKYQDQSCYIIGNGPSLTVEDLDKLKGEYTFGVNKIYYIFDRTKWRPSFYVCVDNRAAEECYKMMEDSDFPCFFDINAQKYCQGETSENIIFINNRQRFYIDRFNSKRLPKFSDDASDSVEAGETVVYNAIQLAVYMGFTTIYLLGVDCNYSNVFDKKGKVIKTSDDIAYFDPQLDKKNENTANSIGQLNAFESARLYCEKHGVKIYNATRGGNLEVLDRVNLDDIKEL